MKRKVTLIIIQCLILFLPLAIYADEPTSIVFTRYQENYTLHNNRNAEVALTLSTENPLKNSLIIPLAIKNNQNAEVVSSDNNIEVSLITIKNQVYLQIFPDTTIIYENNTLNIVLKIDDFVKENGIFFRSKSTSLPLISNYPSNNKNNIFIDVYSSVITLPGNYKPEKDEISQIDSAFKIYLEEAGTINRERQLKISAEYLNLHSIKQELIPLSSGFNPIILMVLIIGLLILYLFYFSSLIKHEDPVKNVAERF
jgi:hypothetical protein